MGFRDTADYALGVLNTTSGAGSYTPMQLAIDFRNAVFSIIAANLAGFTIKFFASNQDARPDLSQSASASNQYWAVNAVNLIDGSSVPGGTGVVIAADGWSAYEVNTNAIRRVGLKMTARSAGDATASVTLADNE